MRKGKPSLVALDFNAGTARRYWPKAGGGFITQTGTLKKAPGDPWRMGCEEGLALLEDFRRGKLDVQPIDDKEYA